MSQKQSLVVLFYKGIVFTTFVPYYYLIYSMKIFMSLALVCLSLVGFSQKVKKEKVSYEYKRNPLVRFDPITAFYKSEVIADYRDEEARKRRIYETQLKNAQQDLQYEMEDWDGEGTKPSLRYVKKPDFRYLPKKKDFTFSLDGFKEGSENVITGIIKLENYSLSEIDQNRNVTKSDGSSYTHY